MALTSTDWLLSSGWRQGLFTHCIEDLQQPIPFNVDAKEEGCYPSRDVCEYINCELHFWTYTNQRTWTNTNQFKRKFNYNYNYNHIQYIIYIGDALVWFISIIYDLFLTVYIKATAGLCILSLVTDVIATILTGIGLHTKNQNTKYRYYRRAVLIMLVACKYSLCPMQQPLDMIHLI